MNKKIFFLILSIVVGVIVVFSLQNKEDEDKSAPRYTLPPSTSQVPNKIKECPDAWYKSSTPVIVDNPIDAKYAGQYFMINDERRELRDYNIEWIEENCEVNKPLTTY